MRRSPLLAVAAVLLAASVPTGAAPAVFPRTPALSPDGRTLAFSFQGDLWLAPSAGGAARRITAHPGYDHRPVFFPDGKLLAFSSDREGSDDVFVLDLSGGEPRRLTYHEAADVPRGVVGAEVLFTSRRHEAWDRKPALYQIPSAGGTERLASKVLALEAAVSPDGKRLVLVRGGTPADRRHYRGAANRDLWLLDLATDEVERLTSTEWDEDSPAWAGPDAIAFRSDGGGPDRNLYRMDLKSRKSVQVTRHTGADVRGLAVSGDGRLAVYELWDALYAVPLEGSSAPKKLELDVPADAAEPSREKAALKADADEVAVSPDGSQVALVVKGDVFLVPRRTKEQTGVAEPPTVRVTATPWRERDVVFSPDGKELVFASDRHGSLDLFRVKAEGKADKLWRASAFVLTRVTEGADDEHAPRFSPDGKQLAWVKGSGGLVVANADGTAPKVLFEHWGDLRYVFSPDGKWLAVSREDQAHNNEVFLVPVAGGKEVNVSQHPADDLRPSFSADGRFLYFLSMRHGRSLDVFRVALARADHERSNEEWLQLFEDEKGKKDGEKAKEDKDGEKADKGKETKEGKEKAVRPVVVDADGIHERVKLVKTLPGEEREVAVSPDGQTIVFVGEPDGEKELYKLRWDGKELVRLTTGGADPSQLAFSKDGKAVFYRTGKGTVGNVTVADGKAGDPVPFTARVEHERGALRAQVFDEAWRELDRGFYDAGFHGADWKALRDRYRPLALAVSARRDYDDVLNLMLGELNASHMGFRPPQGTPRAQTGALGVEVVPAPDGKGVVVTEVLEGTPAARTDVGLAAGDRVLAVAGQEVGPKTNVFAALSDTVGQRLVLRVKGASGAERDVVVTPARQDDVRQARYDAWVKERRALAEKLSGGRLGYVHIQAMGVAALEDFERDLYAAANGKEGLLIDVRNNGGGSTTDYLMAILNVRRHAWTVPRGGDPSVRAYPQDRLPLPAWTRPAATLCDEASYSNAEIFSWAFQTLKRGPVIGSRTFGAVISTGGARLVDGSTVRLPGRGWFVAGSGVNMENNGCRPDVEVEKAPAEDLAKTKDTQLEKAVEVLLAQLPKEPSARAW